MLKREDMMTATEVAYLLRLHIKTVYRLARNGGLPCRRVGGSWRFIKADVITYLKTDMKQLMKARWKLW